MFRRKPKGTGLAEVEGGVVGWLSGGEPIDGCDLVSVLVFAPSRAAVVARTEDIGLWGAYLMDGLGEVDPVGVAAAMSDPDTFVWNRADGGEWRPSATLPRP